LTNDKAADADFTAAAQLAKKRGLVLGKLSFPDRSFTWIKFATASARNCIQT
jgi:hypothetical protein